MTRRRLLLTGLYVLLIVGGWIFGALLSHWFAIDGGTGGTTADRSMAFVVAGVYAIACAVPFVPGAEIGIALIAALGVHVAYLVYFGMVGALAFSHCVGRFVPARAMAALFGYIGLNNARSLVLRIADLNPEARIAAIAAAAPNRVVPFLLRHRYIALALVLNVPGNAIIGGGGGISIVAGMSGLFRFVPFVATVAIAALPLPLIVLVTGYLR